MYEFVLNMMLYVEESIGSSVINYGMATRRGPSIRGKRQGPFTETLSRGRPSPYQPSEI